MGTVLVVSKQWWSLLSSLTGRNSKGRLAVPSAAQLADYCSSKLSGFSTHDEPPVLESCHHSFFWQFWIKKSNQFCYCLMLVGKSVGDDELSPRVLKGCTQPLSGTLTKLFCQISRQSIIPALWKISRITPVFKKGSWSDPSCYCPIAVLPTLSQVFERLSVPQLWRHIEPHIPWEQFGFKRGSSASDAGVCISCFYYHYRHSSACWDPPCGSG